MVGTYCATLHGGPRHGEQVQLQPGQSVIRLVRPVGSLLILPDSGDGPPHALGTREGIYTPVAGCPGQFEWDGWER